MTSRKVKLCLILVSFTIVLMLSDFGAFTTPKLMPSTIGFYAAAILQFYAIETNRPYMHGYACLSLMAGMDVTILLETTNRSAQYGGWFTELVGFMGLLVFATLAVSEEFANFRKQYEQPHEDDER
jgi:hypothetical protein